MAPRNNDSIVLTVLLVITSLVVLRKLFVNYYVTDDDNDASNADVTTAVNIDYRRAEIAETVIFQSDGIDTKVIEVFKENAEADEEQEKQNGGVQSAEREELVLRFQQHPKFSKGRKVPSGVRRSQAAATRGEGKLKSSSSSSSPSLSSAIAAQNAAVSRSRSSEKIEVKVTGWENVTCDACKLIVWTLKRMVAMQNATDDIIREVTELCKFLHIESDRVCGLVVKQYADMAIGVIQGTVLEPDDICGVVLGDICAHPFNPFTPWNITISSKPKPPVKPRVKPQPNSPTLRVLHLTDLHLDIDYAPGADAECGEPLCCRAFDQNPAPSKDRRAGDWGDYRHCDLPYKTLDQLFQHLHDIKDQFDYVMFTGDIPAHDVWNQTRPQQLANLERLSKMFRKYLPDTPVYTAPGNHEGVPCNSFPPSSVPGHSMDWYYSASMQAWGYWLPDSAFSTIMRGGFYTLSPYPGFRIISFNSNFGASLNWWLFLNTTDPEGQLQWLADVLQEAEDNGEKVHILSHHPPGETLFDFASNYYRLVNRYESIIAGQFHGHTHKDEFELFYDLKNLSRPVGMSYIGGSVTPYSETNSAYRIYTIDGNYKGSSYEVLDYSHYYLDLPLVNSVGKLVWLKEYTASETYYMPSLFPEDWNNLIYWMKDDDDLFNQYYKFYYKSAKHKTCSDYDCKKGYLCKMKTAMPETPEFCSDL